MSNRPAETYLIVTQGVDQMLTDLGGNDIERVAQMRAERAERERPKGLFKRLLSWRRSNA